MANSLNVREVLYQLEQEELAWKNYQLKPMRDKAMEVRNARLKMEAMTSPDPLWDNWYEVAAKYEPPIDKGDEYIDDESCDERVSCGSDEEENEFFGDCHKQSRHRNKHSYCCKLYGKLFVIANGYVSRYEADRENNMHYGTSRGKKISKSRIKSAKLIWEKAEKMGLFIDEDLTTKLKVKKAMVSRRKKARSAAV